MTTAESTAGKPSELDALIALAEREHRAGRMAEAAAAYRKILALRPNIAEVHNYLGDALLVQGRLDEAAHQYLTATALKPGLFQAHNNLGNILRQQGQLDQAVAHCRQAIALRPDYAEAHNNLGIILWQQDKLDQAIARFEQVLALRPGLAETHNNLGGVLVRQGRLDEAAVQFAQAAALRPDLAEVHNNLGIVFGSQGRLDQAVASFERALALRPDYSEAINNLGNVLREQGKPDQAAVRYRQALTLQPNHAETLNNLGNVLREQGDLDQAVAQYQQAIALRPDYAEAHYNLGFALWDQGRIDGAAASYRQALTLRPDYANAQFGLAACFLVEGDYQRGWPAYEARLRIPAYVTPHSLPRWTGEPLAGRSLLLLAEQGLGDTFHFVRYARLLKQQGARVVLACPAALERLLAPLADVDELFILGSAGELPRCDFALPLLSAPGAFRTAASTIPCEVPYLSADPVLTNRWRKELAAIDGFKIAIAWQGARAYRSDPWRSIPLAEFAPLAGVPGVRLISLQKGFGSKQIATVDFPVLDLSARLDDAAGPFMDTAAVIRGVDLVVTPDTAIAHLAGALGSPVWVALPFSADWRWLRDRDDTPWYPTMRLFRQTMFNEWGDVFERIAAALDARRAATA